MNKFQEMLGVAFVSLALLSGCGSKSEKVCVSAIKSNLINPETAEFFEFRDVSMEEFGRLTGQRNAANYEGNAADAVMSETGRILKEKMSEIPNATFHSVRVKADGKLGNKITQNMLCISLPEGCACDEGAS